MLEFLFSLHCSVSRPFQLLALGVLVPLVPAVSSVIGARSSAKSRSFTIVGGTH